VSQAHLTNEATHGLLDGVDGPRPSGISMCQDADHQREGAVLMKITTIGLDIAKNIFQVHGIDDEGRALAKKNALPTITGRS